jgi:hypothetical protein
VLLWPKTSYAPQKNAIFMSMMFPLWERLSSFSLSAALNLKTTLYNHFLAMYSNPENE